MQVAAERIMVVEDDRNIQLVLKYRLEKEGYRVLLAGDGADALEKVRAEKPDLIILDLALPKMDGFEFLEHMRGDCRSSDVPVIVLTAYGYESNRARSLELGAVEFVTKPFSPRQLVAEVWKVLCAKKKRVLVIDDEASVRDLLARLLEAEGCLVDTAEDGPSGIEKALIIAEKLKRRIVITAASPGDESVHLALEKGALACVSKPCNIEE